VWLLAACAVRGLAVAAAPAQAVTFSQQTLAFGGLNQPRSVAVDAAVDVFLADAGNNQIVELPAGGSQRTVSLGVTLSFPAGVAVDAMGDLFIADTGNNRVVELTAAGVPKTLSTCASC
jgi:streptogramin lyase